MALALKDRVKETTIVVGTGAATLLGSSIGFQPFSVVGNGNTTYYCISDQFGSNWEVGIGTYSSSGNTLDRTTVLASSNGGALVVFTAGVKDVFVTYPAEKGVWLDSSNNAIGLGTPAAFVGTNITGTASGLTAGNVTTNANLSGAVSSIGNSTSLGSFTSLQLKGALTDETGSGAAVFATSPTIDSPTYTGTLTGSTGILNIGSGQLYKDASGNVGIGTSSPSTTLHVKSSNPVFRLETTGTVTTGGVAFNTIVDSTSSQVWINGFAGLANCYQFATAFTNGFMRFLTGNQVEAMRIDASGNVGIGTSSPAFKLDVVGDIRANPASGNAVYRYSRASINKFATYVDAADNYIFFSDASVTERMRIDASGTLFLGQTTNPATGSMVVKVPTSSGNGINFQATGAALSYGVAFYNNSGGNCGYVAFSGTTTSYVTTSDYRLKENIAPMVGALNTVAQLKPVIYKWKANGSNGQGFIAHELQVVVPDAVVGEKDAVAEDGSIIPQGIDPSKLVATLTAAIQELKAIIDTQQEQINSLLGK